MKFICFTYDISIWKKHSIRGYKRTKFKAIINHFLPETTILRTEKETEKGTRRENGNRNTKGKSMKSLKGVKSGKPRRKKPGNIEENARSGERRREKKDESTKIRLLKRLQIVWKTTNWCLLLQKVTFIKWIFSLVFTSFYKWWRSLVAILLYCQFLLNSCHAVGSLVLDMGDH